MVELAAAAVAALVPYLSTGAMEAAKKLGAEVATRLMNVPSPVPPSPEKQRWSGQRRPRSLAVTERSRERIGRLSGAGAGPHPMLERRREPGCEAIVQKIGTY